MPIQALSCEGGQLQNHQSNLFWLVRGERLYPFEACFRPAHKKVLGVRNSLVDYEQKAVVGHPPIAPDKYQRLLCLAKYPVALNEHLADNDFHQIDIGPDDLIFLLGEFR